jgi:hypothetical protein
MSNQPATRTTDRHPMVPLAAAVIMAVAAWVMAVDAAEAAPILNATLNSPATIAACNTTGHPGFGVASNCVSTSYQPVLANANSNFIVGNFDGTPPTNQTFTTAFNNWNTAQGANYGGNWKLINGGNLDVTFTVTDTASAAANLGGISTFTIGVAKNAGYVGPAIGQLVWTQGLYDSYSVMPPFAVDLNPPSNTLDTWSNSKGNSGSGGAFTNPCTPIPGQTPGPNNTTPATIGASPTGPTRGYCDPIYPFQNGAAGFGDGPQAFWPDESFRAIALLSTVTFVSNGAGAVTERDLTVYNGVSWGFDLSVPEPASMLLLGPPAALIALLRRRTRAGGVRASG